MMFYANMIHTIFTHKCSIHTHTHAHTLALYCTVLSLCIFVCFADSDSMSCSGVFITCMAETERIKVEGGVDVFQTVKATRAQRPHMVNTSVSAVRICI